MRYVKLDVGETISRSQIRFHIPRSGIRCAFGELFTVATIVADERLASNVQ